MADIPRTQAVTTSWAARPDVTAKFVSIKNKTGADVLVARTTEAADGGFDADTQIITLADGESVGLQVVQNSKELSIKAASGADGVQLVILNQ